MDLGEGIEKWFQDVSKTVRLSASERSEVTAASAKPLLNNLRTETRSRHFDPNAVYYKNGRKVSVKRLADSIIESDRNIDGKKDGRATVGFQKSDEDGINHARIAGFLNDGTKFIPADHFYDNTIDNSQTVVFATQAKTLAKLLHRKWEKQ